MAERVVSLVEGFFVRVGGDSNQWLGDVTTECKPGGYKQRYVPFITSISLSSPASMSTYLFNETIEFRLNYNKAVTLEGHAFLHFFMQGENSWRGADYHSGSGSRDLVFRYTVKRGDLDSNGIQIGGTDKEVIGLGSGASLISSRSDESCIPANRASDNDMVWTQLSGYKVDGRVGITDLSVASTPASGNTYRINETIAIDVTFEEPVTVQGHTFVHFFMASKIGGSAWRGASYESGSGTNTLRYSYTVRSRDSDGNGISIGGAHSEIIGLGSGGSVQYNGDSVRRSFSGDMVWNALSGHKVDGTVGITGLSVVSTPEEGVYHLNDTIEMEVTFGETVTVQGGIFIHFFIGGSWRRADYESGSGTNTLRFRYTVKSGDNDDSRDSNRW